MLELYHNGSSVCAAKVRTVLAEKGLDWKGHYLDILAGDQFDPAYLKLNPRAVVPTLVHDGTVVVESTVICEYIEEVFPEPPLRPADAAGRARMRVWTKYVDEALHPAIIHITFVLSHRHTVIAKGAENTRRFIEDAPDHVSRERRRGWIRLGAGAPEVREAVATYGKALRQMEAALTATRWLAGDGPSLADFGILPYVNRLDMLSLSSLWADGMPHVADWFDRMRERPSFRAGIEAPLPPESREALVENGRRHASALIAACGL